MTQNCNNSEQSKQKKTCLCCGSEIEYNQRKFCCKDCRLEYHEKTQRTCESCGKTFTYRWSWRLCHECHIQDQRNRRKLPPTQRRRRKRKSQSKSKRTSLDEYIEYKVAHPQGYSYGYFMAKLCGRA